MRIPLSFQTPGWPYLINVYLHKHLRLRYDTVGGRIAVIFNTVCGFIGSILPIEPWLPLAIVSRTTCPGAQLFGLLMHTLKSLGQYLSTIFFGLSPLKLINIREDEQLMGGVLAILNLK